MTEHGISAPGGSPGKTRINHHRHFEIGGLYQLCENPARLQIMIYGKCAKLASGNDPAACKGAGLGGMVKTCFNI